MKLLHVVTGMDPKTGGVSQAVRTMIASLSQCHVDNELVTLDEPGASFLSNDRFTMSVLGPTKSVWRYSSTLYPWLLDNLSRFDVAIIHGLWLYHGYAVTKAIRKIAETNGRVPKVFVMPHGMLDPYFQKAASRRLKACRNWVYWKTVENSIIHRADGLFFTCEVERRLAAKAFKPYCPQKEVVVGLGVEDPPVWNEQMDQAFIATCPGIEKSNYLLFLSRIHEKKGVDLLISAYANLINAAASNVNKSFPKLVIAGPGIESAFGKSLKELVEKTPLLQENILFSGMLTGDAKWGALYGCDAFVLPSHQENFGIAVVEALACGKAVLISKQVNISDEIIGEGAGLVGNDTLEGTEDLLKQWYLLSSTDKIELKNNAVNCFKTKFRADLVAQHLAEFLEQRPALV